MRNFSLCTILIALLAIQPVCAQEVATIPLRSSATSPTAAPSPRVLPKGTEVHLVLLDSISSANATKGQPVRFAVAQDVVVNGVVVIPRGTQAEGVVAKVRKGIPSKRDGTLLLEPQRILLSDGSRLTLSRNPPGEDDCGDMGPCLGLAVFAIILSPIVAAIFVVESPWIIHHWIHEVQKPHAKSQIAGDDKALDPCEVQSAFTKNQWKLPISLAQPGGRAEATIHEQLATCQAR
jgi:hypothetical protein